VNIPGDVSITTVGGRDDLRLYLENGKSVTVTGGGAADYIQLSGAIVNQLTVNTDPRPPFTFHSDRDVVRIARLTATGDVSIHGGDLRDDIGIGTSSRISGKFSVDLGLSGGTAHLDTLSVSNMVLDGPVDVAAAQAGVVISNVVLNDVFRAELKGFLSIRTGSGNDDLTVSVSVPPGAVGRPNLSIDLGEGDDSLSLTENRVRDLTVDGGDGTDTLTRFGENAFDTTTITSVEEVIDF
jgi:hypothetical protein